MQTSTRFAVAIHILTLLAQDPSDPATSEAIAGSVTTNPVVIRRVLAHLRNQQLVESQPGSGGGWRLLRDPSAITLRDVYRAINPGCVLSVHERPSARCAVGRHIQQVLETEFTAAQQALETSLAHTTIADILGHVRARDAGHSAHSTPPDASYGDTKPVQVG